MVVLVKAMKNPRSALCKTSIMASSDIFTAYGDQIMILESSSSNAFDPLVCSYSFLFLSSFCFFFLFFDELCQGSVWNLFSKQLLQLLLKASQDKKFVCEEADKTLNAMVVSMTPLLLLHKLRAYVSHSNPRIRAKAAVFMSTCASKMVISVFYEYEKKLPTLETNATYMFCIL